MYNKLVSLSIPSGWAVIHNFFGDEDLVVSNGSIVNDDPHSHTIKSIRTWPITDYP
jgi:hypothetical protein